MKVRRKKQMIGLTAALLAATGAAVAICGVLIPVRVETDLSPQMGSAVTSQIDTVVVAPQSLPPRFTVEQLRQICAIDLRQPLFDPPSATPLDPAAQAPPPAALPATLVATVHEAGHSMAMFRKSDGLNEWLAEGEQLNDGAGAVIVRKIERDVVTVTFGGRTEQLKVPLPMGGSP